MTGTANSKSVSAGLIIFAAFQFVMRASMTENSASHENVAVNAAIGLNLFETFIHPMDTVLAVNHKNVWVRIIPQGSAKIQILWLEAIPVLQAL